jgi:hypothetical protein
MLHTECIVCETKYNLLADAKEFLKEPGDQDHKVQFFALFVNAHHHNFARERQHTPTNDIKIAPPSINHEMFELIMTLINSRTVSELLKDRQNVMTVDSVRDLSREEMFNVWAGVMTLGVVTNAFPDINSEKKGYRHVYCDDRSDCREWDDVVCLHFEKLCENVKCEDKLKWSVTVDLKQIYITVATEQLVIPDSAITVQTNASEMKTKLKLNDDLVSEMLGFRLQGVISNCGHKVTLSNDTGHGFVLKMHIKKASVDKHEGHSHKNVHQNVMPKF